MNVKNSFNMKKTFETIASVMVMFALVVSAFAVPVTNAVAVSELELPELDVPQLEVPELGSDFPSESEVVTTTESGDVLESSDSSFIECALEASRVLVTIGDSITLNWNVDGADSIKINGESVSGDSGSKIISNLQENTLYTLKALNENGAECIQKVEVVCEPPEPPKTPARCEDFGYDFTIAKFEWDGKWNLESEPRDGYAVSAYGTLTAMSWTSEPAADGVLAKAATEVESFAGGVSGGIHKSDVGTGDHDLSHVVLCGNEKEEPEQCKLKVEKVANTEATTPGKTITYTIDVANIGTADCTGGGVRIKDELSSLLTYVSSETSDNISGGYGSDPVYDESTRTLWFNGHTLTPGEWGRITVTAKVNEAERCGDYYIENKAKATAKELENFSVWAYSDVVKTKVENKCDVPEAPKCPLTTKDGRIIVNFDGLKLRSDQGIDKAFTASQAVTFGAGEYDITLVSWDGYTNRVNANQPNEQWQLEFLAGDSVVGQSGIIGDLADNVIEDTKIEKVNDGYVLANTATAVRAAHPFYPDTSSANSLFPICAAIDKEPEVPTPACEMYADPINIVKGGTSTLTWTTEEVFAASIDQGVGSVAVNGSTEVSPATTTTYTLTGEWGIDDYVYCPVTIVVEEPEEPAPTCDMFTATPGTIMVGGTSTLAWETTNATQVFINNGIGGVAVDGTLEVSPLADIVYKLTAIGAKDQVVDCEIPVKVSEDPVPVCEFFTATPNSLPVGGGDVTLDWSVDGATSVSITPTIGAVALVGTTSTNVTQGTTFTLTAVDDNGDEVTCSAPVAVADPVPFTCADNVDFSTSHNSIRRGGSLTLTWDVTGADSVSISGINATAFSGSEKVSPSSDVTYVLTATKNNTTIECPVSVDVTSGGGGGSASPRCDLEISDTKIDRGDEITLEWNTSNATALTLSDDRGNVVFTTDDYLADEKEDYYDGSITLKPTRDTKYTLVAERGSRDRECSVEVELDDDVVVLQTRDQQPLVAGISLSQVPYTGFEAGPFMTLMFYALLVAWALYVTYLFVIRNRVEVATVTPEPVAPNVAAMKAAEEVRPDLFAATAVAPVNLPTGTAAPVSNPHQANDAVVAEIENQAHSKKALLSSDAIRHFVGTTENQAERKEALDEVITEAKKMYPLEDGWIVINESRMRNLCEVCQANEVASTNEPFVPATVPEGSSSLAEAIVTGNVVAAYEMIGSRPMFALADAAADLDAVYRKRRGNDVAVSDMLVSETTKLSDDQIKNMIAALTSALDGTYTDEASAVKMAIMKAVKEVA